MIRRREQIGVLAVVAVLVLLASWGLGVVLPDDAVSAFESNDSSAEPQLTSDVVDPGVLADLAPDRRGETPRAKGTWLSIRDRESLAPLAPSRLLIQPRGRAPLPLSGPGPWSLDPDLCGPCEVHAAAPGHVSVVGSFTLTQGENRILLPCTGELRVTLRDAAGQPASGVRLALIPPTASQGASANAHGVDTADGAPVALLSTPSGWTLSDLSFSFGGQGAGEPTITQEGSALVRVTNASGCAHWSDVTPLAGYRWAVAEPRHVDVEPPHEQRRFEENGTALRVSAATTPDGISGRFDVLAGLCTELKGTIVTGATVRGRIASAKASGVPRVVLFRVEESTSAQTKRGVSFESRHAKPAEADGSFEFVDVRPGTWMLRAWWAEDGQDLYFTACAFRLTPGAELDLGQLSPLAGSALEVTIALQDARGRSLAPTDVYPASDQEPIAQLCIDVVPADGDANHMLSGVLPLPFGQSVRVHGLRPGRVHVRAQPGPGLLTKAERVTRIDTAEMEPFEVGTRDEVLLAFVAHLGESRPLVLTTPTGERTTAHSMWVHDLESNRVWVADTSTRVDPEGNEECSLALPDGTYELWCKLSIDTEGADGLVGFARATFGAGQGAPLPIVLRRGARITGIVRNADGKPAAGCTLRWSCEGWPLGVDATPMYSATTDEHGAFELSEVPTGLRLFGEEPGTDLAAVDAGVRNHVELMRRQ